jgi:hypothetical protein
LRVCLQAAPASGRWVVVTTKPQVEELDELIERCAGIDVGQAEVLVCPGAGLVGEAVSVGGDVRDHGSPPSARTREIDHRLSRLDARARNFADLAYPSSSRLGLDDLIHEEVLQTDRLLIAVDVWATWADGRPVAMRELAGATRVLNEAARLASPTAGNAIEIDAARRVDLLESVTDLLRLHGVEVAPDTTPSVKPDGIELDLEL